MRNSCDVIKEQPVQTTRNIKFYNCYCNHLDNNFYHLLDIHQKYEQGILYYPGSLSDQPNKLIEAFNLISHLKREEQIKQEKKQLKG